MLKITTLEKKNFYKTDYYVRDTSKVKATMVYRQGSVTVDSEDVSDDLENYNPTVGITTYNFDEIEVGESVGDDYEFSDDVSEEDQQSFIDSWQGGNDSAVESLGWEFDDGEITVSGKLNVEDLDSGEEADYPLQMESLLKEDVTILKRLKVLSGL
jgi:hypothetical protein